VVLNAGVATEVFEILEDNESTITVDIVSNTWLTLLLLANWEIIPVIAVSAWKFITTPASLSGRHPTRLIP